MKAKVERATVTGVWSYRTLGKTRHLAYPDALHGVNSKTGRKKSSCYACFKLLSALILVPLSLRIPNRGKTDIN